MEKIAIVKFKPRKGIVLNAIELTLRRNPVSCCCTEYRRVLYCKNKIVQEEWSSKCDASFNGILDRKIAILENHIVIPELDKVLELANSIDISKLEIANKYLYH